MKNQIILNKAKFWTDEREILFCRYSNKDNHHELDVDTVERYEDAIMTLTKGKRMPFLIDMRNTKGSFNKNATKLFANSKIFKMIRMYEAFVVNSLSVNLAINSYKRIYEPNTPFIILTDFERAIDFCIKSKERIDASN